MAQGAALCGATRVIGIDLLEDKLDYARSFGLTDAGDASREDLVAAIQELTGGIGVDYALDAVGDVRVMEQAFRPFPR